MRRALAIAAATAAMAAAGAGPAAAQVPTKEAGRLTVALSMPAAGFQVGSVKGRDVVFAKGLEIDLVEAIADRLDLRDVRYVNEPRFSTLLEAGDKRWDLAIAQITITAKRRKAVDFSSPYFAADQGVLLRRGFTGAPKTLATVARLKVCAERGSTGADVVRTRIKPTRPPRLVKDLSQLEADLYQRRCDVAVADAPQLGVMRAQAPRRFGALVGRIRTGERYGIAFERGSDLKPLVDDALEALEGDGTIDRLARRWLTTDVERLPILR